MPTHTAIAATAKGEFDAIQVPTGTPGTGEVLLKAAYSAMIAFDTYTTDLGYYVENYPTVLGFSASGTVAKVGKGVEDLVVGDRVTAMTYTARSKGMQEYSIQPRSVCAKIPDSLHLESAAAIPDNFITAFYTLFNQLALPIPPSFPATSSPPLSSAPILIYGAGSTAGQYAIQLLHAAGYKNVIATASEKHHEYLRSLGATGTFDYNSPSLAENIAKAIGGDGKVALAMDSIATEGTLKNIAKVIRPGGTVAVLLPIKESTALIVDEVGQMHSEIPEGMNPFSKDTHVIIVRTFLYQQDEYLRDNLMPKILPGLLASGTIQPNRVRLLDQGSFKDRVATGLDLLRNNKISGEKVVVKVEA